VFEVVSIIDALCSLSRGKSTKI